MAIHFGMRFHLEMAIRFGMVVHFGMIFITLVWTELDLIGLILECVKAGAGLD